MAKHVIDYIRQPETLDTQALGHLRSVVDKFPYYHAARILMLKALYEKHDSSFDEELRRAAIYIPSRKTLFQLFEAENLKPDSPAHKEPKTANESGDRTENLIDNFLDTLPKEPQPKSTRPVDATVDYISYLIQTEGMTAAHSVPEMPGQQLIENFLNENEGKFEIKDLPTEEMQTPVLQDPNDSGNGVFTEALARIYIKQGKFDKAIEIIQRLSLKYPKKNRYFADQIRFLEKIIANEKAK